MTHCITWVGMDDSASKINIAILRGQETNPREDLVFVNDGTGLGRLAKKLKNIPGEVRCVYEAGVKAAVRPPPRVGMAKMQALSGRRIYCPEQHRGNLAGQSTGRRSPFP